MLKKSVAVAAFVGLVLMGVGEASAENRTFGGHGFGGPSFGGFAHHVGFGNLHFGGRRSAFGHGFGYGDALASAMIGVIAIGTMAAAANGAASY